MIEDEIREEINNYEIKTTSRMILDRAKPRKKLFKNPFVWLVPAFCTALIVIALILSINVVDNNSTTTYKEKTDLLNGDIKSQLSCEILYAGALYEDNKGNNVMNSTITEDEFSIIVNNIDNVYPLFDALDDKVSNFELKYKELSFKYDNVTYKYEYIIGNYKFYSKNEIIPDEDDDEIEFEEKVLFKFDEEYYQGEIDLEIEDDESELSITYYQGNNTIKIQCEREDDEISYKYTLSSNNKKSYEKKLTIEDDDDELTFKYQYKMNDLEEKVIIVNKNDYYKINYLYENDDVKYEENGIILKFVDDKKEYSYKNFKIIK